MKFCPYCGAGLNEDMRFCPKCGKPFEESKENPHLVEKQKEVETPVNNPVIAPTEMPPVASAPPKKRRGLFVVAILVLAAVFAGLFFSGVLRKGHFADKPSEIAKVTNSVVMLSCYDPYGTLNATGSGFAAFDNGIIVTNYHVIENGAYSVKAETESGASFDCNTLVAYDKNKDIAILKTDTETGLTLLTPGNTNDLKKGEKVVAIGSPLGLINSVSTGVFSGYLTDTVGTVLQFTAAISHGSSGGALFNNSGEVIGITYASLVDGQNLNLAIPVDIALRLYQNTSASKAISIKDFYTKAMSSLPAVSCTISDLHENFLDLNGRTIIVSGYLSTENFLFEERSQVQDSSTKGATDNIEAASNMLEYYKKANKIGITLEDNKRDINLIQFSIGDHLLVKGVCHGTSQIIVLDIEEIEKTN